MSEIEVKLKADVNKVVDLYNEDILSKEESTALLNQFTKVDLINSLLEEELDMETDEEADDGNMETELTDEELKPIPEETQNPIKEIKEEITDDIINDDDDNLDDLI